MAFLQLLVIVAEDSTIILQGDLLTDTLLVVPERGHAQTEQPERGRKRRRLIVSASRISER